MTRTSKLALGSAIALLSACGAEPAQQAAAGGLSSSQKVEAIASTLQSCSYDGRPVEATPAALSGTAPNDCSAAVKRIMEYTGLPANFVVVSGPVPNAAAVILLDGNRVPRRVIAFNPAFMSQAAAQVGGNPWGPMSVMAHEIAHHLSGHTIVPGGSRPEIELEADKFSGFVLQKMGAPLDAATKMILAVGSDHGSPTHPAKAPRAEAIRQGWTEACRQAGGTACDTGAATPATIPSPVQTPGLTPAVARVNLPTPGSVPFKYGRFVVDETGRLDAAKVQAMDQKLYALARDVGVEVTFLVVNDLRGMSAKDYAWAMMRQLRVGKLDVGNGAVAVIAPRQRQAAVAFGPGLAKEAEFSKYDQRLVGWIDNAWRYCEDADGCAGWTDNLLQTLDLTLSYASRTKWTIQFQTLDQLLDHYEALEKERMQSKRPFEPERDQPIGNLLRLRGRLTSLSPPQGPGQVNPRILGGTLGYTAVSLTTDDGLDVILYVSPQLVGLMPSGKLRVGQNYTVVGRLNSRGDRRQQPSSMWLFSYDPI